MDNEDEQVNHEETETDEGIIGTPEEQKERLIHAYLTMEKDKNEQEEPNRRRELIQAYSKRTMDNDEERTEQDEIDTYLRTSMEEEQEPSTWEEYDEEEPLEGYDKDEPFEENDDEGKWTTQFSYPTEEEENALFIAFMTGTVEDQKKWINAKMNLARATINEETRRREEEILDRIIPTGIVDLDEAFEEDEEETDDLSECQPYDLTEDQEEDFTDEFIDKDKEDEDIQLLESLTVSYRNHEKQDEETTHPLSSTSEFDDQLIGTRHFTEPDKCWRYDNEHIKDEDKWEMAKTNRMSFEPMVIFSSPYSPTTSQIKMNEIFQNQKSDYQTIQTKEGQDTEDTSQSKNDDLFTKPGEYTSWVTRAVYEGLINPKNQPQMDQTKPQDERNINGQDYIDIIILLGRRLFPNLWDQELSDERTFESNDGWFDPIKTLSAHGLKRLPNHFSKVTAATSVNDVIAVN